MNPPSWYTLEADAAARRVALWRHVRQWAAAHHVATRARRTAGYTLAALDATGRPVRGRLLAYRDYTAREAAEAAADDLWDATAVVWHLVHAMPHEAGQLHHVVAELQAAGRWLASWPVHVAAHDTALAELFTTPEVVA